MINTKIDRKNLYLKLDKLDIITKVQPLLDGGTYYQRPGDGKIVPKFSILPHHAVWAYVQTRPDARCDIYRKVFYKCLGHIHSYCRECWKVVVRPRTVVELFDLYELQRVWGVPCKCGLEVRQGVEGEYGGYFYTRSQKEGLSRLAEVRRTIAEEISPEIPVFLKRYCTEFELGGSGYIGQGPSDQTPDATQEELEYERYVESFFPDVVLNTPQPEHALANTMKRWIHHAQKHKDLTYLEFTEGQPLTKKYVTYEGD